MMRLSVIIPTHNRQQVLARCLKALAAQEGLEQETVEVIVVDDGSTDDTGAVVDALESSFPWPLRYYQQTQRGPAAARNKGIVEARGKFVHFINDDTIATPNLLARHLDCHAKDPDATWAVLGFLTWLPQLVVTPFMRWAERAWYRYDKLQSGRAKPDFTYFITCNLSLKREFLLTHGVFDEEFGGPAWEDIELGYRLEKQGLQVVYCPEAIGYHDHSLDLQAACRRLEMVGRWAALVVQKVPPHLVIDRYWPSIARWPGMSILIPHTIEPLAGRLERKLAFHPLNKLVTTHYFLRGMAQGVP